MSISRHAAAHKPSYLMMLIVQSVTLPLLFLFLAKALTPIAQLSVVFVVLAGIACFGLLVAAWVPDTNGSKSIVHKMAAYSAAALIIPMLIIICLSSNISTFAKYMASAVLVYDVVAITVFAASTKKAKDSHLYFQIAYIFLFAFTALAAVFIR
jgi:hypothetical protein